MIKHFTTPLYIGLLLALGLGCNKSKQETPNTTNQTVTTVANTLELAKESSPTCEYQDQWDADTSLLGFRESLRKALELGNQELILNSFSSTIEFNPGVSTGPEGVKEIWSLDGSMEKIGPLKALLSRLISSGGCLSNQFEEPMFFAPFYNCLSLEAIATCDSDECGVIDSNAASLLEKPETNSRPLGKLSKLEIVSVLQDTICNSDFSSCAWRKIRTNNGLI
jgi:hypothetical protein